VESSSSFEVELIDLMLDMVNEIEALLRLCVFHNSLERMFEDWMMYVSLERLLVCTEVMNEQHVWEG